MFVLPQHVAAFRTQADCPRRLLLQILNHLYSERSKNVRGVTALGTTHRYRSKYITVVIYKAIGKQNSKVDKAGVAQFMQQVAPGGTGTRKVAGQ